MEKEQWIEAKAVTDGIIVCGVYQPWSATFIDRVADADSIQICTSYGPYCDDEPEEDWHFDLEPIPSSIVMALPLEAELHEGKARLIRFKYPYVVGKGGEWALPREIVEFLRGPRQSAPDIELPWEVEG